MSYKLQAIFGDLTRSVQETCNNITVLLLKNHCDNECQVNQSSFDTFRLKGTQICHLNYIRWTMPIHM